MDNIIFADQQVIPGTHWPINTTPFDEGILDPAIPNVPGVYYFLGENSEVLYIGKSIHVRKRLLDHLKAAKTNQTSTQLANSKHNNARSETRQARMVGMTESIAWRQACGDTHAQLIENREIKQRYPVFNRAQRRLKTFYSWRFKSKNNYELTLEQKMADDYNCNAPIMHYGAYKNANQAKNAMLAIANREQLCLRILGLEKGQGPCFRSQINKCAGACAGKEAIDDMQQRLIDALMPMALDFWPFAEPLLIKEGKYWHVFDQWQSYGVYTKKPSVKQVQQLLKNNTFGFDKDEYLIVKRFIFNSELFAKAQNY